MESYFIIDSHCDTIELIADYGLDVFHQQKCHVSLEGLKIGRVGLQFFAAFVTPRKKHPCLQRGLELIKAYQILMDNCSESFMPVLNFSDINTARSQGKIGALLTVEGGDVLEGNLHNLRILYDLGVRAMTLTWNYANEIADGVLENDSDRKLSTFGHKVIREMNRLGMLIDVSHLSEKGFYSVLETSEKPIAATHSNAWSVCPHPRNLKNDQIVCLAKAGGVMGINFYPPFLSKQYADINDILRHIEYIAGIAGIDVIGFGSDFDGIEETLPDVCGPQDYERIINALLRLNYKERDVKKIAYENYLRVLREVLINGEQSEWSENTIENN